ncbi:MAG TPA: hypothetical protein DEP99_03420 [Nitrospiraceae bacterium]|nr:hypothetical protein [Nitrospiraceae bacterium]
MKKEIAKKTAYIGAGAGLVMFALFGLLPGSFLGGIVGLNIAGKLFGLPLDPSLIARLTVVISMLMGVMIAGVVFVAGFSILGWLIGYVIDRLTERRAMGAYKAAEVK